MSASSISPHGDNVLSEILGTIEGKYVTGCIGSKNLEVPKARVYINRQFHKTHIEGSSNWSEITPRESGGGKF
jgi:hypothetical protein